MTTSAIINGLSALYDMDTRAHLPSKHMLYLLGSKESYFLTAVEHKCKSFKIPCVITNTPYNDTINVIDKETFNGHILNMSDICDIDHMYHDGMSSVSQAVSDILSQYGVTGKHVVIVGRGHAVKGLDKVLLANDATVTVCHSKTAHIQDHITSADILILATPKLDIEPYIGNKDLVIDVGDVLKKKPIDNYTNRLGKLTISILLNRLVKCGGNS